MSNKELHSSIYKSQNCIKLQKSRKNRSCSGVVQSLTPSLGDRTSCQPCPAQGGQEGGIWDENLCNKIIMRTTELPGNSQGGSPCSGAGPAPALLLQSPVHSSASPKFQSFHYFHLYLMPRGAEPTSEPLEGAAPAPGCQQCHSHHPWERGGDRSRHSHSLMDTEPVHPPHSTVCTAQSRVQPPGHGPRLGWIFFYFFLFF